MANGGGFFDTPERTVSWLIRLLLLIISGFAAVALWLAKEQLTDLKTNITDDSVQFRAVVQQIFKTQTEQGNDIVRLNTVQQEQQSELAEHASRLQSLERKRN